VALKVEVWPRSTTGFEKMVGAPGAVSADATVTVADAADVCDSADVALSLMASSKV